MKTEIMKSQNKKNENLKFEIATVVKRNIDFIVQRKKSVDEIEAHLMGKGFSLGAIHKVLTNPFSLTKMKMGEICLFLEQFYAKTGIFELNPLNWFENSFIRKVKEEKLEIENSELGISIENVVKIGETGLIAIKGSEFIDTLMQKNMVLFDEHIGLFMERNGIDVDSSSRVVNVGEVNRIYGALVSNKEVYSSVIELNIKGRERKDCLNNQENTLLLNEDDKVHVLKGFSHMLALKQLKEKEGKQDFEVIVIINFLSDVQEKEYLLQL